MATLPKIIVLVLAILLSQSSTKTTTITTGIWSEGYTSLRNYRDRTESSGISMIDWLNLNDAELQALMHKKEGHRTRDVARYAFMQENVEEYAREMRRKHMT